MWARFLITFMCFVGVCLANVSTSVSPWEHSGAELTSSPTIIPGQSPITYPTTFTRERELFGYKPRFMPSKVNFDKDNRPYIYIPVDSTNKYDGNRSATNSFYTTNIAYLQTLDDNGNWVVYDIADMLETLYPNYYNPTMLPLFSGGLNHKKNVVFGDDGSIYFNFYENQRRRMIIVYSNDDFSSMNYAEISSWGIGTSFFEAFDTFLSTEQYLPTLVNSYRGNEPNIPVTLYELEKNPTGELTFGEPAVVGADSEDLFSDMAPLHSGTLNVSVTVGDTVHTVWFDYTKQLYPDHTDQYYSSYNRTTKLATEPVYLGSTFGNWYGVPPVIAAVDTHNGPVITVGRDKTIHVVLGGHHSQSIYRYSTDGGRSWSEPYDLPGGNSTNTYPAIITDRDNTVHLIYRWSESGRRLAYSRKKQGQQWEDMGALVIPHWWGHGQYHHNLTVDRLGRLFVAYWYSATSSTGLPAEIQAEYDAKWPGEPEQLAHDPVILMTDNGGDSWKIATTADFAGGIIDDTVPAAVYNFDSSNIGLDMASFDNNFVAQGSPVKTAGIYGDGVSFDGTTDGLKSSLNQAEVFEDGSFTVVGWFKPDATVSGLSNLVNAKTGNSGFALSLNNGQWIGYTYADGYTHSVVASADTTGQWKHIAFTYKADGEADSTGTYTGTSKLYVDGSLVATQTARKYSPQDAVKVAVAMDTTSSNFFACSVDELGIFSGAMPEQKIVELAENSYRPQNVSRELLYQGDFNGDGTVDVDDIAVFANSWLEVNN